jgi:hypothetical protein
MNQLLLAALASLFLTASAARAQEERWDARIAAVSGDVVVRAAEGGAEAAAEAGMPLEEGDEVVVAAEGSAEVALDGGSLITVRENSEFKIEKAAKSDATFFLKIGSLLAKIQKLGENRLRVKTPTAVAAVRGTEFGVEVEGDSSHVGVFDEGKVAVSGDSGEPELLISNQETSVAKGMAPVNVKQLQRFVRHRARMRGHARRIAAIRAKWKALPPQERGALRNQVMERMRAQRVKILEKRREILKKKDDSGRQRDEAQRKRMLENRRKMEERRERIRPGAPRRNGP